MTEKTFYVATDVETTGLNPADGHLLLEIFVYIVEDTYPYRPVEPKGFHRVIQHDPEVARRAANQYVQAMHEKTGLWNKLADGTPVEQVDEELLAYLQNFMKYREGRVLGNSIRLDMNFMEAYLPQSLAFLHYRSLDVSGLAWFAHQEFNVPYYEKDEDTAHSAQVDIEASLQELRHIREYLAE